MAPSERKLRIMEYVRQRLRDECAREGRGHQAVLARAMGTSTAHIANMLKDPPTRNPGEDFRHKVAAYWKVQYGELERLALGEPEASVPDPARVPLTREDLRKELEAAGLIRRDGRDGDEAPHVPPPGEDGPKKHGSGNG